MNIVFLSPHSDPEARIGEADSGGQCIYEYELAKSLSNIPGVKVTIFCRKKFNHPSESIISPNFQIKRLVCGGNKFIPKEKLDPFIEEFTKKVARNLQPNPPDIVHGHYWDGGKTLLLLSKHLKNKPLLLWTPHSLGAVKRKNFP